MKEDEWVKNLDGGAIEYTESEFFLFIFLKSITEKELESYSSDMRFNLRFVIIGEICFFIARFGNGAVFDLPYSPSICENPMVSEKLSDDEGITLNLFIIDSEVGELKYMRSVEIGHELCIKWLKWYEKATQKKMTKEEFYSRIDTVYNKFSIEDLQDKSRDNSFSVK